MAAGLSSFAKVMSKTRWFENPVTARASNLGGVHYEVYGSEMGREMREGKKNGAERAAKTVGQRYAPLNI